MCTTKTCRWCGETKPVTAFRRHRASRDGLQGYCKDCANWHIRQWSNHRSDRRRVTWAAERAAMQEARA